MTPAWSKARGPEDSVDLARLNRAERTVLGLLAQGHTAKSIATITGKSVGSVNERLREARRKTGIGSSRELARLFAAQENRDELIGVAGPNPTIASSAGAAKRHPSRKGYAIMTIGLVGGAAALLFATQTLPQDDISLIGTPISNPSADARELNARLRTETRDEAWASATEAALEGRFASIRHVSGPLKVRCAATVCQIAGWIGPTDDGQANVAMKAMQSAELARDASKFGLDTGSMWFQGGNEAHKTSFVIFFSRKSG